MVGEAVEGMRAALGTNASLTMAQGAVAEKALALTSNNAAALLTLASARLTLGELDQALTAFDRLVALTPDDVEAWAGRGKVLFDLSRWSDAVACYDRVLALEPSYQHTKGQRVFARLQAADWDGIEEEAADVVAEVRQSLPASPPFQFLAISDSAADQRACIAAFTSDAFASSQSNWSGRRYVHDRIRIAYVSPDFRNHAMAFLAAGLFEQHDRRRFETIALSLGPDDGSTLRRVRLPAAFDRFIDVRERTDAEITTLIGDMEVDICIDLAGHTTDSRIAVFAARPAPVQVNYLGFPATMGVSYYDYIIGDRVVIPEGTRPSYAEKVVELPDCYQANDDRRPVPGEPPPRSDVGLPDKSFVFCCFNSGYKLHPAMFDVWMRLLQAVPGSVLWLVARDVAVNDRLREEARRRGIDRERLIFAKALPYDKHLTRFQLADLFLDTIPYNGGATTSDALWCGVPVVTCSGEAFASRMAASLLTAVGMPELAANNLGAYEALALRLAADTAHLNDLKERLRAGRSSFPLFDTARFTRNLEVAYTHMWRRAQDGLPPEPFAVGNLA
jgi:predicted O-linked N-acetylglucosamine transferase (SPINDLY family)